MSKYYTHLIYHQLVSELVLLIWLFLYLDHNTESPVEMVYNRFIESRASKAYFYY